MIEILESLLEISGQEKPGELSILELVAMIIAVNI